MVLPGTYGPFGDVGAMHVGWGVLEFCIILSNEGLHVFGGLIVQSVKLGSIAADSKKLVDFVVSFDEFTSVPRLNGIRLDIVGIDGVEDHNIVVSAVGCDGEATGLIGE